MQNFCKVTVTPKVPRRSLQSQGWPWGTRSDVLSGTAGVQLSESVRDSHTVSLRCVAVTSLPYLPDRNHPDSQAHVTPHHCSAWELCIPEKVLRAQATPTSAALAGIEYREMSAFHKKSVQCK